jgi:hypothetical protein
MPLIKGPAGSVVKGAAPEPELNCKQHSDQ